MNGVGIELREIYQGGAGPGGARAQQRDSVYQRICCRARELYGAKLPAIRVTVDFREKFLPAKREVEALARSLARLAEANIPPADAYRTLHLDDLPDPFTRVAIGHAVHSDPTVARWEPSMAGFVQKDLADEINEALAAKNPKADICRGKAAQAWLVLVIAVAGPATFLEPDAATLGTSFTSAFDRTFLFDEGHRRVWELRTI